MLRSGLTLYCYTLPTSQSGQTPVVAAYQRELEALTFVTASPGGFVSLSATIKLNGVDVRLPQPQLSLFAHVALMNGSFCCFVGEIMQPPLTLDSQNGDYIQITALGVGNQLRDDPRNASYVNQTPAQIANAELTRHTSTFQFWPSISTDASGLFTDNPSMTSSPTYDGRNSEEILLDQMTLAGDYAMTIFDHPTARDAQGFPLGRIRIHPRDANGTTYIAALLTREITDYSIQPDATRAYNFIEIVYDTRNNGTGFATAIDPRLAAGFAQNTAPFRARKFRRDLSGITTVTATLAQQIANAYLNQFQNPSNKVSLTLAAVRDALGNDMPLWQVRADGNIWTQDMAVRGQQLPQAATARVNQFYIYQTTYTETATDANLKLECDNYADAADRMVARLTLAADQRARGLKFASLIQATGASEKGRAGLPNIVAAGAGVLNQATIKFHQVMSQVPTSITLSATTATNITGVSATSIDVYGFILSGTSVAAGPCSWDGHYTTVGN